MEQNVEINHLASKLDLMVDEFARIKSLTDNNEIKGICERAIQGILQIVPIISQRDNALAEITRLEESLSFWKKDSAMVTAALHRAEEEANRLKGENEKYKQALETLNVTALLDEITRLEGEVERLRERLRGIEEAYEQFNHLDILISDLAWNSPTMNDTSPFHHMLYDLWQVIKKAMKEGKDE